ncbi:portal protein [Mesorhizobium sp. A556]
MAKKSSGMTDGELVSLLDKAISKTATDGKSAELRDKALKFIKGEVDFPHEKGKSSAVSHDTADTLHWILPSLLRAFLASENVGIYEPRRRKMVDQPKTDDSGNPVHDEKGVPVQEQVDISEEEANQATDYVNYILMHDCRGYSALHSGFYEGLAFGNGLIKHWYDPSPRYATESYSDLSDDAFAMLVDGDDVEIIEHTQRDDPDWAPPPVPNPEELQAMAQQAIEQGATPEDIQAVAAQMMEAQQAPQVHDCKIKTKIADGSLCVKALPHEEFFIGPTDTVIDEDETLLCGHSFRETRSELVRQGYDRDKINDLPVASATSTETSTYARLGDVEEAEADQATEQVQVHECYIKCDYDGDGVSEWRKVVLGGVVGEFSILENEEWGDDLPFTDLVPDPVPHRWRGRSIFDETVDIQRIKTVLLRQTIDNLYQTNNPQKIVRTTGIKNPEALLTQDLGQLVYTDGDPATAVKELVVPFTAGQSYQMLEYLDMVRESRTGVSRATTGLDLDALQNQTATAVNASQSSAYAKMESYARNLAENGMKRLFKCLLRLLVKHQDKSRMIRLRGKWVEMNPRAWDAEMDVTINTGLGSGSRDRDLAMLGAIVGKQEQVVMQMGPFNEFVNIGQLFDTYRKMAEVSGIKSAESYFPDISQDQIVAMRAKQAAEQAQQPPDPKAAEMQAKLQMEQQKQQFDMKATAVKMQADTEERQAKMQMDAQARAMENAANLQAMREEASAKLQLLREETAARIQIAREEMQMKHEMRLAEMQLEAELTAQANMVKMSQSRPVADTNITGAQ